MLDLKSLIRSIPDYPKPGILFRDITTLIEHPQGFRESVERLAEAHRNIGITHVAGIEARGFIFGAGVAIALGVGFVPIRKRGKLPARTIGADYALEYGSDRLEMHADALPTGARVALVDDVVATGGTLLAARALIEQLGAELVAASVVIELAFLGARARWAAPVPLHALIRY